jgi:hypothetical protein
VRYAVTSDTALPESTSEEWAIRVHRLEKWRQMGEDNCKLILESLTQHLPGKSSVVLVRMQALPIDWVTAGLALNQAPFWATRAFQSAVVRMQDSCRTN